MMMNDKGQSHSDVGTADDDGTSGWDSSSEDLFAPGTMLLSELAERFAGQTREQFLETVGIPYLLVSGTPNDETASLVMTQSTPTDAADSERRADRVRVAPLSKRLGSNSFLMMITLGRTDNNDLVLKHSMLSKFHAYFRDMGAGKWTICDAGSRNGTTLDGRRLAPERSYPLKAGAQIVLGEVVHLEFADPFTLWEAMEAYR